MISLLCLCISFQARYEPVIKNTAVRYGIAPIHLIRMAAIETENTFNPAMAHDKGKGWGLFAIHTKLHGITKAQACNPKFAAEWTCRNLLSHGYKKNPRKAIERHVGRGKVARTYARRVCK